MPPPSGLRADLAGGICTLPGGRGREPAHDATTRSAAAGWGGARRVRHGLPGDPRVLRCAVRPPGRDAGGPGRRRLGPPLRGHQRRRRRRVPGAERDLAVDGERRVERASSGVVALAPVRRDGGDAGRRHGALRRRHAGGGDLVVRREDLDAAPAGVLAPDAGTGLTSSSRSGRASRSSAATTTESSTGTCGSGTEPTGRTRARARCPPRARAPRAPWSAGSS